MITPFPRIKSGAEGGLHGSGPQHSDPPRQVRGDAASPGGLGASEGRIKMCNLPGSMNAAVGPARRGQNDLSTRDLRNGGLQCVLYSAARGLRLPPAERPAVIFQANCDARGRIVEAGQG